MHFSKIQHCDSTNCPLQRFRQTTTEIVLPRYWQGWHILIPTTLHSRHKEFKILLVIFSCSPNDFTNFQKVQLFLLKILLWQLKKPFFVGIVFGHKFTINAKNCLDMLLVIFCNFWHSIFCGYWSRVGSSFKKVIKSNLVISLVP